MGLLNFLYEKFRGKLTGLVYLWESKWASFNLKRNHKLWSELEDYLEKSESTGCSYTDYWALYSFIRRQKPVEILECGPGATTLIMAHALKENEKETGIAGYITSMEEIGYWCDMVERLLPENLKENVDLVLSRRVEDAYSIFRGVRYENIPDRPYDFVFVDGPDYKAFDGMITFDFDFIHILRKSDKPVSAIVDKRVSTVYVLQKILGLDKVRYNGRKGLGLVAPCTKSDLREINSVTPSLSFADSIRILRKSNLKLCMEGVRDEA